MGRGGWYGYDDTPISEYHNVVRCDMRNTTPRHDTRPGATRRRPWSRPARLRGWRDRRAGPGMDPGDALRRLATASVQHAVAVLTLPGASRGDCAVATGLMLGRCAA